MFQGKPERTESFIFIWFGLGFVAVVAVVFVLFCCFYCCEMKFST